MLIIWWLSCQALRKAYGFAIRILPQLKVANCKNLGDALDYIDLIPCFTVFLLPVPGCLLRALKWMSPNSDQWLVQIITIFQDVVNKIDFSPVFWGWERPWLIGQALRDLCKTPPFAQFRRQAQILILEILNVCLRLKLSPSLILNPG